MITLAPGDGDLVKSILTAHRDIKVQDTDKTQVILSLDEQRQSEKST